MAGVTAKKREPFGIEPIMELVPGAGKTLKKQVLETEMSEKFKVYINGKYVGLAKDVEITYAAESQL